jgi:hypothetical protein
MSLTPTLIFDGRNEEYVPTYSNQKTSTPTAIRNIYFNDAT